MVDQKQEQKQDVSTKPDEVVLDLFSTWPRVGSFSYVTAGDRWHWSAAVAVMHGYQPEPMNPTTEMVMSHNHPDDTHTVGQLIQKVRAHGIPFSSRHRIVDTAGQEKLVVVVGDLCHGPHGEVTGTNGFYVDITKEFDADLQRTLDGIVDELSQNRAVINQAIGVLMLAYGISAERAFDVLSWRSSETNVKVREIAATMVERAMASHLLDAHQRTRLDHILLTAHEQS